MLEVLYDKIEIMYMDCKLNLRYIRRNTSPMLNTYPLSSVSNNFHGLLQLFQLQT